MDIDPRTYPSRTFVRFTAHNQLRADATGKPIRTTIQRFGGGTYVQQAVPGEDLPSISANGHGELSMEVSMSSPPWQR